MNAVGWGMVNEGLPFVNSCSKECCSSQRVLQLMKLYTLFLAFSVHYAAVPMYMEDGVVAGYFLEYLALHTFTLCQFTTVLS